MIAPLLALAAGLGWAGSPATQASRLPGLVIQEPDAARAAFLEQALEAMLESPTARASAAEYAAAAPRVTLRWAPLDSSALSFEGTRTVVTGLSAYTQYAATGTVVSVNARLFEAAKPRELAGDLAHELLGHAAERARADAQGVGYAYAVARDNETAASLLGWVVGAELGLSQKDEAAFSFLSDPGAYYSWRLFEGTDYAAALSRTELPRARETYKERAALVRRRVEEWRRHAAGAGRALEWIAHFQKDHAWPPEPFRLVEAELVQQRDEELPRNERLLAGSAALLDDLAAALDESEADRARLARAARHPVLKRLERQVLLRSKILRRLLRRSGQTEAELQTRPSGQLTHAQLLGMIEADLKVHGADDAPAGLPAAP
jgi:hypothetical protein